MHEQHRTLAAPEATVRAARWLRKDMTLPEVLLWRELRGKPMGVKFRRQFPVRGFVADFACIEARLLVEVDGIVHDMADAPERDARRTAQLEDFEWRVIRISASEILREVNLAASSIVSHALSLIDPPLAGGIRKTA